MFFFRKVLSSLELFQASHEGEGADPFVDVLVILSVLNLGNVLRHGCVMWFYHQGTGQTRNFFC